MRIVSVLSLIDVSDAEQNEGLVSVFAEIKHALSWACFGENQAFVLWSVSYLANFLLFQTRQREEKEIHVPESSCFLMGISPYFPRMTTCN